MKAKIKKILRGRYVNQYRFTLHAANGELIAQSWPEAYTRKEKAIQTLENLFPTFEIVDETKEGE